MKILNFRTNFFMKENKYYSEFSFWLPLGYILALGLFFTEDCERGPRALNREQTDEWRGLMQAVVLIYHVTGASNVLPIYMHLRLINSAYLFLSGYGHFCYFWQTGDMSLVRLTRVTIHELFYVFDISVMKLYTNSSQFSEQKTHYNYPRGNRLAFVISNINEIGRNG